MYYKCIAASNKLVRVLRSTHLRNPNHQHTSVGWFSNNGPKIHNENPFDILGIPKASTYDAVKRRFIEIALKTHPDMSKDGVGNVEEFVLVRQAFEDIREGTDGSARLAADGEENSWSDDNFNAWFYEETGHSDVMFKMDLVTRKEVIDTANSQSQGGLDKGGMWEMARTMAEQEKSLQSQKNRHEKPSVGLESGSSGASSSRRRRRRK